TTYNKQAFCAVRPPGHHATRDKAMGFCLFNNVAIAAYHALETHGLERVAIVDFDVHHGNGTEDIVQGDERILFCSSFQ
ncbi:histone deacetylase family protein, partial [Burkholderia sp. SIMBA_045]